jgi:hypothetical protein
MIPKCGETAVMRRKEADGEAVALEHSSNAHRETRGGMRRRVVRRLSVSRFLSTIAQIYIFQARL